VGRKGNVGMDSISSLASSASAMLAQGTAALGETASAAKTSFEGALSKVETAVVGKPATGFTGGATYQANSPAARTKAAIGSALSAVTIKPSTGFHN
jgi:hypothetical protein